MQAYFETEVFLPVNHHLNLKLPDEIPAGRVRIAVIYEKEKKALNRGTSANFYPRCHLMNMDALLRILCSR